MAEVNHSYSLLVLRKQISKSSVLGATVLMTDPEFSAKKTCPKIAEMVKEEAPVMLRGKMLKRK